jgi:hypothetical protein
VSRREPEPSVSRREAEPSVPQREAEPSVPQREAEPSVPQREAEGAPGGTQRHSPSIQLNGRGAVLLMLVVFALGLLGVPWLRWPVLAGASFLVGSVAAALCARRGDLLTVTVTPPLLFCIVLVGVKAGTATGNMVLSIAEGTAITLAGAAPWLFAGTALTLIIAWARGLRGCVRELRQGLLPGHRRPGPGGSIGGDAAAQEAPPPAR